MTETTPPQGDEMPETPGEEMPPPTGPDEVPPQDPKEEGLPDDQMGEQTVGDLQQGGSSDDSGEGGGPA